MHSLTFLATIFLLFQTVHCFCIYNKFEDDSFLTITDARDDVRPDKLFNKEVHPGDVACCHYSNDDCSTAGKDDEENSFHIYFILNNFKAGSKRMLAHCTTGGALVVYGSSSNIAADCKFANGTTTPVEMIPDEMKPYDIDARPN